jgi:hypothetical protein
MSLVMMNLQLSQAMQSIFLAVIPLSIAFIVFSLTFVLKAGFDKYCELEESHATAMENKNKEHEATKKELEDAMARLALHNRVASIEARREESLQLSQDASASSQEIKQRIHDLIVHVESFSGHENAQSVVDWCVDFLNGIGEPLIARDLRDVADAHEILDPRFAKKSDASIVARKAKNKIVEILRSVADSRR